MSKILLMLKILKFYQLLTPFFCFCRYLVFYSPFDIVYKMVKFLPCKLAIAGLKEVQRAHKVYHGVVYTAKIYPNSVLIILFIGTIKGKILR